MSLDGQPIKNTGRANRRKAVFLTDYWYPSIGGLERSIYYLLGALQNDVEVDLFTTDQPVAQETTRARVWRFPSTKQNDYYDDVFKAIVEKGRKQPIVHMFGFSYNWPEAHANLVMRLVTELDARIVLKVPTLGDAAASLRSDFEPVKNLVSAYIALNSGVVEELIKSGVEPERIVEISNGVPLQEYQPPTREEKVRARRQWSLPREKFLIGFSGRFVTRKRLDLLIEAVKTTPPGKRPTLVLLGHVDETFGDSFSPASHLDEDVLWLPSQHDVRTYYHALDCYVSASEAEGMPNSVLEAMASGLPVVLSDIPGQVDLVREDENGWLFPSGDLETLCSCLSGLYPKWSAGELVYHGERSRQLVEKLFDERVIARNYIRLYDRISQ